MLARGSPRLEEAIRYLGSRLVTTVLIVIGAMLLLFTLTSVVPGDPANRIYVWIDALFNYVTAVDTPERRQFWPASVQMIGKDILWFHAVIWPAQLMALGLPVPECVYAHSFWISEGKKMSKTLGNFIDLELLKAYIDRYTLDALRWYLL